MKTIRRRKTEIVNGTLTEARMKEAELRNKYYHIGNVENVSDITLEQYSELFLKRYCQNNMSLVTISGYQDSLKRIIPIIGKEKLNKITPLMLDNMYGQMGGPSTANSIMIDTISFNVDSMSSPEDGEAAFDAFVNKFKQIGSQRGIKINNFKNIL